MKKIKNMRRLYIVLLVLFFGMQNIHAKTLVKECYYKNGSSKITMGIYDDNSVEIYHKLVSVSTKIGTTSVCLKNIYYCYDGSNSNALSGSVLKYNFCRDTKCDSTYNYTCTATYKLDSEKVISNLASNNTTDDRFGSAETCAALLGDPKDPNQAAYYLQTAFNIVKYLAIIILVVLTVVDFAKAVMGEDKDLQKELTRKLILRLIYAVCIFFIPIIVEILLSITNVYGDCGIS